MLYQIILLSLYFLTTYGQQIEFTYELNPLENTCFFEKIQNNTLLIFHVTIFEQKQAHFTFTGPGDKLIHRETTSEYHYPYNTNTEGNYELCINNENNFAINFTFISQYGLGAKDYSSLARSKDFRPIDKAIEILSDTAKHMTSYINTVQEGEKKFDNVIDNVSSKLIYFSFLVILLMFFVGLLETIYLKAFMRKRKII